MTFAFRRGILPPSLPRLSVFQRHDHKQISSITRATCLDGIYRSNADPHPWVTVNLNGEQDSATGIEAIDAWLGLGDDSATINSILELDASLDGGDGNDTLISGHGDDVLIGGPGTDGVVSVSTQTEIDSIVNAEKLNVRGFWGSDNISFVFDLGAVLDLWPEGNEGNDTLVAGPGADFLYGGPGADSIDGGGGNDTVLGAEDDDTIVAGDGNDSVLGGWGNDFIDAGAGNVRSLHPEPPFLRGRNEVDLMALDIIPIGDLGDDLPSNLISVEVTSKNATLRGASEKDDGHGYLVRFYPSELPLTIPSLSKSPGATPQGQRVSMWARSDISWNFPSPRFLNREFPNKKSS